MTEISKPDMGAYWMPFTPNRQFKKKPRLVTKAHGMYYTRSDGKKILDGCAGLWCVNAGHGRDEINGAIRGQLDDMSYAPAFQMGHPLAFKFAQRLVGLFPDPISHAFFTNSGSEAVDTALKISRAYQKARGKNDKTMIIGRERGYHGVNFGGLSAGGMPANREAFGPLLSDMDHLPHTHMPDVNSFSKGQPAQGVELADALLDMIDKYGADRIAAVIVEPMSGSAGVLVPPKGYLERLRQITRDNDILLIFDEVITAFGRLGASCAAAYFDIKPDIITTAKGLTNGAVPMGAVLTSGEIYETLMTGPENIVELMHGYTYSGHPLACAAGLATLEIYEKDGLFEQANALAPYWEEALHSLKPLPHVADIRNIGLVGAIELESQEGAVGRRAFELYERCFENGLLVRTTADVIALSPPLIISRDEIDRMVEIIGDALK